MEPKLKMKESKLRAEYALKKLGAESKPMMDEADHVLRGRLRVLDRLPWTPERTKPRQVQEEASATKKQVPKMK